MNPSPEFDAYAKNYDEALGKGLSASGEGREYFAEHRVAWLKGCLSKLGVSPATVLDYGCGTGASTPYLLELADTCRLSGVEISAESLVVARAKYGGARAEFQLIKDYQPSGAVDLAFCNGVFHHIPPVDRAGAIAFIRGALRSGGLFSCWENNPWNPGTRYVMSRIPFDHDAITLSYLEMSRLLEAGGFEILRTDFLFYFPRSLSWLRRLEPFLSRLPFGGQYQVLCRRR